MLAVVESFFQEVIQLRMLESTTGTRTPTTTSLISESANESLTSQSESNDQARSIEAVNDQARSIWNRRATRGGVYQILRPPYAKTSCHVVALMPPDFSTSSESSHALSNMMQHLSNRRSSWSMSSVRVAHTVLQTSPLQTTNSTRPDLSSSCWLW